MFNAVFAAAAAITLILDAVVVTTAGRYGEKGTGLTAWATLNEFVFPSAVKR